MSATQSNDDAVGAGGHATWSSSTMFVLAAAGSAVGLGNIWKFPYITGVYGGGAFVLVYLGFILLMGLPAMMTEIMIGRRGGRSPIGSMLSLSKEAKASSAWKWVGGGGMLAAFLTLSFYCVIAGWALYYMGVVFDPRLNGADAAVSQEIFGELLGNPWTLVFWHSIFIALTALVSYSGVRKGIERGISFLMPALLVILILLNVYAATTGHYDEALSFLFEPDFSELTMTSVLVAAGHAFFSLSVGAGIMVAYGSYLSKRDSIIKTSVTICILDTVVALLAGLAIFTVIFAEGLETSEGPGLLFVSLPLAFARLPFGEWVGATFFIMVVFAAWTSAISLLEPIVEWLEERGMNRHVSVTVASLAIWLAGLATVVSFNEWAEVYPLGFIGFFENKTFFDLFDFITSNILLPLVALFGTFFAGWIMTRTATEEELGLSARTYAIWRWLARYLVPVLIAVIFAANLI